MWWLFILLVPLTGVVFIFRWLAFPIVNSFVARYFCGAIFASKRKPDSVWEDLNLKPLAWAQIQVNPDSKEVAASILGMAPRRARFKEGVGVRLFSGEADAPVPPTQVPGPYAEREWPISCHPELIEYLLPFCKAKKGKSHAITVIHKGVLVGEAYAEGIGPETPLHSWSLTKSLMNALTGILVERGLFSLDQSPEIKLWLRDERRHITLRHLLQMTSGLKWKETEKHYLKVSRMLFMARDVVNFSQNNPLAHQPGTHFAYASCNTNIISGMMRQAFGNDKAYYEFPRKALFEPLGMQNTVLETDQAGNFVGSSFSMGTARDWARFGQLYLNAGKVGNTRILSSDWIDFTRKSSLASAGEYGAHFWLNASGNLPDLPRDVYHASGFLGQRIAIFPSQDLVVVRLGLGLEDEFNHNGFLRGILTRLPGF